MRGVRYKSIRELPPHLRPAANDDSFEAPRAKYRNKPVVLDGVRFPSKLQAARHQELKIQAAAGMILGHVSEVSMRLPGGKRMRLDELVNEWVPYSCMHCGKDNLIPTLVLEDAKGYVTKEWEVKRAVLEAVLGVKIRLIRRSGKRQTRG